MGYNLRLHLDLLKFPTLELITLSMLILTKLQQLCRVLRVSPLSTFMFFSKSYACVKNPQCCIGFFFFLNFPCCYCYCFISVAFLVHFDFIKSKSWGYVPVVTQHWSRRVTQACTTKSTQSAATFTVSRERNLFFYFWDVLLMLFENNTPTMIYM